MMHSLPEGYRALVIGASGAIGSALLLQLQSDPRCDLALGVSRQSAPGLDLLNEASIAQCAQAVAGQGPFHLVLDATGALSVNGRGPEKRLDELDAAHLLATLQLNAVGPGLLLKHFVPLLASGQRVIWGKLSARVGSIEDNRKGGWYGYRMAKAALNQGLQTAAIEWARQQPESIVAALQPGTVASRLSRPFVGESATTPDDAVRSLLAALDALQPTGRAHFVDHRGQTVPW